MGRWEEPVSSPNEQVRKTAPVPDYTVSRRAINPALAIHPVLCADLLTNGQMPMTHFPVAFPLVSFPASGDAGVTRQKRSQHYSETDDLLVLCFLTTLVHAGRRVRGFLS